MTFLRSVRFVLVLLTCVSAAFAQSYVKSINLTFTTIDVPGAGYTALLGINTAGVIVGDYGVDTNIDAHGFQYDQGTFSYFDYPSDQDRTVPLDIDDSGLIVGYAGQNPVVGFLYNGSSFTTLRAGNRSATFARGSNNSRMVVGGAGTINGTAGFVMQNGRYKSLSVPGTYVYVFAEDINNLGLIVGDAGDHGFICLHGTCSIVDVPGASQTVNVGVNDGGLVVGYFATGQYQAFVMKTFYFLIQG